MTRDLAFMAKAIDFSWIDDNLTSEKIIKSI